MEGLLSTRPLTPTSLSSTNTQQQNSQRSAAPVQGSGGIEHDRIRNSPHLAPTTPISTRLNAITPVSASSMLRGCLLPLNGSLSSLPPSPLKVSSTSPQNKARSPPGGGSTIVRMVDDVVGDDGVHVCTPNSTNQGYGIMGGVGSFASTPKQLLESLADRVDRSLATPTSANITRDSSSACPKRHLPRPESSATNGRSSITSERLTFGGHRSSLPARPASSASATRKHSAGSGGVNSRVSSAMSLHKRNSQVLGLNDSAAESTTPVENNQNHTSSIVIGRISGQVAEVLHTTSNTPPESNVSVAATPHHRRVGSAAVRGVFANGMYLRTLESPSTPARDYSRLTTPIDMNRIIDSTASANVSTAASTTARPSTTPKKVPMSILYARKWRAERGLGTAEELERLREERVSTIAAKKSFDDVVEPVARRTIHTPAGGSRSLYDTPTLGGASSNTGVHDVSNTPVLALDTSVDGNTSDRIAVNEDLVHNVSTSATPTPSYLGNPQYTNDCSDLAFDHVEWTPYLDKCAAVAEEVEKRKRHVQLRRAKDVQSALMQHMAIKEATSFWKRNPNPAEEIRRFKLKVGINSTATSSPPAAHSMKPQGATVSKRNKNSDTQELLGSSTFHLTSPSPKMDVIQESRSNSPVTKSPIELFPSTTNLLSPSDPVPSKKASFKKSGLQVRSAFIAEISKNPSGLTGEDRVKLEAYMKWSPMGSKGQHQFLNRNKKRRK